jgi:hypothetical protein
MNGVIRSIIWTGERLPLWAVVALVLALNVYWTAILNAFGSHFIAVSGQRLLDLVNVEGILSVDAALALIQQYNVAAQSLYWIFFGLDSFFPPLVFGSFALLWVHLLRMDGLRWETVARHSAILLVPFGVGLFDCIENVFFVTAVAGGATVDASLYLQVGLVFVWLKAICLFVTFIGTVLLVLYRGAIWLRWRLSPPLRP